MSGANNYGGITGGSGGGNDDSGLNDSSGSGISDHPRNGSIKCSILPLLLMTLLLDDV